MSNHVPARILSFSTGLSFNGIVDASMQPREMSLFISLEPEQHQQLCDHLSQLSREAREAGLDGEWREQLDASVFDPDSGHHLPRNLARAFVVFYASGHARIDVESTLPSGAKVQSVAWRGDISAFKNFLNEHPAPQATVAASPAPTAEFGPAMERQAAAEGWSIFKCLDNDEDGPWQVQCIAFPEDFDVSVIPRLESEELARKLIALGTAPHHLAARQFLRLHSPQEYDRIMALARDGKALGNSEFGRLFPAELEHKAVAEGWTIFECEGSAYGRWQIQRLDDPLNAEQGYGIANVPDLVDDEAAMRIVALGTEPHHVAAREFLRLHSPQEYDALVSIALHEKAPKTPDQDATPSPM